MIHTMQIFNYELVGLRRDLWGNLNETARKI
jgi:hypothetical protein